MTQAESASIDRSSHSQVNLIVDNRVLVRAMWNKLWTHGFSNPLAGIEQLSYLIFMRLLDEEETRRQGRLGATPIFSESSQALRWSRFKELTDPVALGQTVRDAFNFICQLGERAGAYGTHMRDAVFSLAPMGEETTLLGDLIELIDRLKFDTRGVGSEQENLSDLGDLYEFMLNELSTSGKNGQFRTPRHIINMIVELMDPRPWHHDVSSPYRICDPSCGTGGFLVSVAAHLKRRASADEAGQRASWFEFCKRSKRFDQMFLGYDFDATMLRIASMNLMLHGVSAPEIIGVNSISQHAAEQVLRAESADLILANPPFKGSVDLFEVSHTLLRALGKRRPKTRPQRRRPTVKSELLFLALILEQLKIGGRAAVIVPEGVLFSSSKAHQKVRETLVECHLLEAVISMPSGVFKPYASVSTAVLIFTKVEVDREATERVWFYKLEADGFSLDDKRSPTKESDIPDLLAQWAVLRNANEAGEDFTGGARTSKSFFVPRTELADQGYDLSMNRYQERIYDEIEREDPREIIGQLLSLETEIIQELEELKGLLG